MPKLEYQRSKDYKECLAAYNAVIGSTKECIHTRRELTQVLQYVGKNPTTQQINSIWASSSGAITFDELYDIAKDMKSTSKSQLLSAFHKIDINGDGYITEKELYEVLTSKGEKMSHSEVKKVLDSADLDKDGKLNYEEFCAMMVSTTDQCKEFTLKKLASSRVQEDYKDNGPTAKKRTSVSRPSSVQHFDSEVMTNRRDSTSTQLSVRSKPSTVPKKEVLNVQKLDNSIRIKALSGSEPTLKSQQPKALQTWNHAFSKGCFFIDENKTIISHIYTLELPFASDVWLTTKPYVLSKSEENRKSNVDVGVFICRRSDVDGSEDKFVCFTERNDDQVWFWRGDLRSGKYLIIPFTSGCRFKPRAVGTFEDIELVRKDQFNQVQLSRAFRECLSDIFEICDLDGNGLLCRSEFNFYQILSSNEEVDDEAWQVVLDSFETKGGEITREGFVHLHLMQAQEEGVGTQAEAELMDMVQNVGFNGNLDMDQACPFELNVFTKDCKAKLCAERMSSSEDNPMADALVECVVSKNNTHTITFNEGLIWHIYATGSLVATVLENKTSRSAKTEVNCSMSKNCMTQKAKNSFVVRLPGHSKTIVDQAAPAVQRNEWTYHCSVSSPSDPPSKASSNAERPSSSSSRKNSTLVSLFD